MADINGKETGGGKGKCKKRAVKYKNSNASNEKRLFEKGKSRHDMKCLCKHLLFTLKM